MILKKPYGFLIKHFKFIHLIITAILSFLAIKNREIYVFLKKVIVDNVNKYDALNYIDYSIFIYIVLVAILCFIIYWLLKYKDKPRNIYVFSIFGYFVVGIIMFVTFAYIHGFSNNAINQKTIRLYKDILLITQLFQYYIIIVMFVRGLGFDIKKFNFSKDAQELNLTDSDGEEIEVNVGIDTTNIMRKIRKQKREFGYFFKDYKIYIIGILLIIFVFLGYKGYNYYEQKIKKYNQGELIGYVNNIIIRDSYYSINDKNNIIINFDIMRKAKAERFNTGNLILIVGNKKYTPDKNICYKFNSLGNCYKKQYIDSEFTNYIITYTIDEINIEDAYLLYNESYDLSYRVKLNPKNWEE